MMKNDIFKPFNNDLLFRNICIFFLWILVLYSNIIQYRIVEIPHGMAIIGSLVLFVFILMINGKNHEFIGLFSSECAWILAFMVYMLCFGLVTSPQLNLHVSQWFTSLEYIFVMMVIVSLVKETGTDSFQYLLLFSALILGLILIIDPVEYTIGRYSISVDLNPNGLGMTFVAGIWSGLYLQQKKRVSPIFITGIILFLMICIINTGSRKSLVASIIVILSWGVFCFIPTISRFSLKEYLQLFIVIVILILIIHYLFFNIYLESDIARRMGMLHEQITEGERNQLYKYGWNLFKKSPVFGIGFSGFYFYNGQYSHATFVEIPVSGGIIGVLLYFTSYVISIIKCFHLVFKYRSIDNCNDEYDEAKMLLILWAVMIFYCTCVIHPYQFLSCIIFGIIFGKVDYLNNRINNISKSLYKSECLNNGSTYIKM